MKIGRYHSFTTILALEAFPEHRHKKLLWTLTLLQASAAARASLGLAASARHEPGGVQRLARRQGRGTTQASPGVARAGGGVTRAGGGAALHELGEDTASSEPGGSKVRFQCFS
jgi:hypothetical protein